VAVVCWIVLLAGGCRPAQRALPPFRAYDRSLTVAVENVLAASPALRAAQTIAVSSDDGVVTLGGEVPELLSKVGAQELVETVSGVRAVINRIEVKPRWAGTDGAIAENIREALEFNPGTRGAQIQVDVAHGHAALRGLVNTPIQKKSAAAPDRRMGPGPTVEAGVSSQRSRRTFLLCSETRDRAESRAAGHRRSCRMRAETAGARMRALLMLIFSLSGLPRSGPPIRTRPA
jgi:hypothetical protein